MKKIFFGFFLVVSLFLFSGCGTVETDTPASEITTSNSSCEAACENYVDKCLTLVPGATENLFKQGRESCFEECVDWGAEKTECIAASQNCTYMTDECEL